MPAVTINISDATYRALQSRAAQHGFSTEAEMLQILETAVRPEARLRIGSALAEISRRHGLTDEEIAALDLALARETGSKTVDAAGLRSLTASMQAQTQSAADLVRSMRDGDSS